MGKPTSQSNKKQQQQQNNVYTKRCAGTPLQGHFVLFCELCAEFTECRIGVINYMYQCVLWVFVMKLLKTGNMDQVS